MQIAARYCSKELLRILENKEYQIHSNFDHGFNISVDKYLCFVGDKDVALLPYGIVVEPEMYFKIKKYLLGEKTVVRWNDDERIFRNREFEISCADATIYSNVCGERSELDIKQSLDQLLEIVDDSWVTGLGKKISQLYTDEKIYNLLNVMNGLSDLKILESYIGLGQGLTPSGDDLLLGFLFVDYFNPFITRKSKDRLLELCNLGYTTDASVHYYRSAFDGLFSSALLELRQGLIEESHERVQRSVESILKIGHTSGKDLLAGVIVAMKFLKEKY